MFSRGRNIVLVSQRINLVARYSKKKDEDVKLVNNTPKISGLLSRYLDINSAKSHEILKKHQELLTVAPNDINKSLETLKSLEYSVADIRNKPMILYMNSLTIENRFAVFRECGCIKIPLPILVRFISAMNREIHALKSHGIIPYETNVPRTLEKCFSDVEIKLDRKFDENITLKCLRKHILDAYLHEKLNMNNSDLNKLWRTYSRVRHKSFKSVAQMVDILINDLNFPKERIVKNGYLLYGDPDNVRRMLRELPKIGNENLREILYRRPKIMMSSCDAILQSISHIRSFNIPETAVIKCLDVLTLGPDTILERLKDLNSIEEFKVLTTNPRVLRLVHYQSKARIRLDYLNQIKVRCASLHILSCDSDAFAKFAREGTDRTKGRDVVIFLSNIFGKDETDVRNSLSRHPNWCHIPIVAVKHCYDSLISKKFSPDDIYHNIHILLYPVKRITEKLSLLQSNEIYAELHLDTNYSRISNRQLLTLCLYLIELEFHFTGDGIWTEQYHQQVENFHSILPDFPEEPKVYKFGLKPPKEKITESSFFSY